MTVRTPHVFVGGSTTSPDHFNSLSDAIEDRAGRNGPVELEGPVRVLDGTGGSLPRNTCKAPRRKGPQPLWGFLSGIIPVATNWNGLQTVNGGRLKCQLTRF